MVSRAVPAAAYQCSTVGELGFPAAACAAPFVSLYDSSVGSRSSRRSSIKRHVWLMHALLLRTRVLGCHSQICPRGCVCWECGSSSSSPSGCRLCVYGCLWCLYLCLTPVMHPACACVWHPSLTPHPFPGGVTCDCSAQPIDSETCQTTLLPNSDGIASPANQQLKDWIDMQHLTGTPPDEPQNLGQWLPACTLLHNFHCMRNPQPPAATPAGLHTCSCCWLGLCGLVHTPAHPCSSLLTADP